jgi:hypothetical protein
VVAFFSKQVQLLSLRGHSASRDVVADATRDIVQSAYMYVKHVQCSGPLILVD